MGRLLFVVASTSGIRENGLTACDATYQIFLTPHPSLPAIFSTLQQGTGYNQKISKVEYY